MAIGRFAIADAADRFAANAELADQEARTRWPIERSM